jgi:RNA polymerase sigma factor (sigma-70 family)
MHTKYGCYHLFTIFTITLTNFNQPENKLSESQKIKNVWKSFQLGSKEAFAIIYKEHLDTLYHYGAKLCYDMEMVKDAIQEVFLDLYLNRKKNNCNPENLKYYLILALKRNLIKKMKFSRKQVEVPSNEQFFEPQYSIEKEIVDNDSAAEKNLKLCRAIEKLPAKQKEALYLRFNESIQYPEIAKILNISIESVRKQVYRALKSIRESIEKEMYIF